MNLQDLKNKATASELALIEAVEAAIQIKPTNDIVAEMLRWISINMPPSREEMRMDFDAAKRWRAALQKHLEEKAK